MNISPPKFTAKSIALLSAMALMLPISQASAGETAPAAVPSPQFSVQSSATRLIGSSARAFHKGKIDQSIVYSRMALKTGLSKSRKAIAFSNLCAAFGANGQLDEAMTACNAALDLRPSHAYALSNRGALLWHAGDHDAARADFRAAKAAKNAPKGLSHNIQIAAK